MKYDFDLDLVNNNSLSWILEQLKSNSTVLEFGPAMGRLTKYMKEQLNCKVYLAELDESAGKEALKYGEELVVGDIENYEWLERYQNIRFDFMIFADVLEHLRNPEEVLVRAKHLLKPEGTILLSVPNFAHNSVLINLLKNQFEYTSVGLLDNTHIHMFTKKSLDNMLLRAGLVIEKRIGTYSKVGTNEIKNTVDDIPEIDKSYWLSRDYGEVYQFVYTVKKGAEYVTDETNYLLKDRRNYYAQLFTGEDEAGEDSSIKHYMGNLNETQCLVFHNIQHKKTLRFDPLNAPCIAVAEKVTAKTANSIQELKVSVTNAKFCKENMFVFDTTDPIIEFQTDFEEEIAELEIVIRFILLNEKKIVEICDCLKKTVEIAERRDLEYEEKLCAQYKEKEQAMEEVAQVKEEIVRLKKEIIQLQDAYQHKDAVLEQIMYSRRWKLVNLLRRK